MNSKVDVENAQEASGQTRVSSNEICETILIGISLFLAIVMFPVSWIVCIRIVSEFQRAIIFRLGKVDKSQPAKGPGLFFILPCVDEIVLVDLRIKTYDIPGQEILTKDSVTVKVDAIVNYFVSSPFDFVVKVQDAFKATNLMSQTALRNVLGTKDLTSLLCERDAIAARIKEHLAEPTAAWGIYVLQVEIKDVQLPFLLQRAMAAEAEASREAKAKVVAAQGELEASKALKEAAAVLSQAPFALQLRYLQTLNTISAEKNSTIIFPLPMELLPKSK